MVEPGFRREAGARRTATTMGMASGSSLPTAPGAREPRVVLVVDDSAVARLAVARRLRAEGFEVLEHASVALPDDEALGRLACALLDLDLGDDDGTVLACAIRARRGELPIAFFSGTSSTELLDRARAIGPVFAKPSEIEAAIAWVGTSAL
jgi:DNA-binding response OmpR family regulator